MGDRVAKFSVAADRPIRDVVEYMHENNLAAVAVSDGAGDTARVVGVFSERDLLRRVVRKRIDIDRTPIRTVMSTPVFCISIDEPSELARAIMVRRGLNHLVVLDDDHQFAGFVSSREFLEADLADSRELVSKLNDDYYEHHFRP